MFARKLQPSEYWRAGLNMAVAFESPFEYGKELEKSGTAEANPLEDYYGAFPGQGEPPVASVIMNKKQVRFDGHVVKMGGVGGVATLPAYRRGGAVRACMEVSLRDLYQEGYALSHLYPFSTAYYRQFGFASAGKTLRWRVRLQDLRLLPDVGGRVRQLMPGDDLGVLTELYDRAYGDINFSCLRETFDKGLEGDRPLGEKRWIFLWSDSDGVPGGFLIGSRVKDTLHCVTEFSGRDGLIFTDAKALIGLLRFVHTAFIANFQDIEFGIPDHIELAGLLPEISGMDYKPVLNGMARAVNVEMLLKLCRCKGEGKLALGITDTIIPENNDTFLLDFAPGRENVVKRIGGPADIEMDVGNLAVLLGGCRGADSIAMTPDIRVVSSRVLLPQAASSQVVSPQVTSPWAVSSQEIFSQVSPAREASPQVSAPQESFPQADAPGIELSQVFYRKPCHVLDLF